ncbi:hypothetical protein AAFC00_004406 [Neodothiora populina]|uniref:Major facilitator superfamily (MFS) profile domain-containing protein n=1 Tax=Neodothiora populina TaxID=2781224 RepID=A0ABR3PPI2_9PEZI
MGSQGEKLDKNGLYLLAMLCWVSTLNSATQGYDSAMMNGLQILPSYAEYFRLTTATTSLNVAIVFVGSVIATPFAGILCDKWGRKVGMSVTAFIALTGATIQAAAVHEAMFCIGRLIIGISVTTGSTAAPAYVSEVSHPKYRVLLTGLCGAAWYVGSVMAAAITFGTQYLDNTWSWRAPSLLQFFPSVCCLVVIPFIPESPRWLVYQDRHEEALAVLLKYHGNGDPESPIVTLEYQEIVQTLEHEKSVQKANFKALVATRPNRWRFGVVAAVSIFCQISGNNIISYYLGSVLTAAGVTGVQTQLAINIGLSVFNLIMAIIGSGFCDRVGRRPSFLISTTAMAFMLVIVGVLNAVYANKISTAGSAAQILMIFIFYGCYSLVWTPLAYLYPLEVLSFSLRASGMASYNGLCYLAAFFNTYIIPYAMEWSSWKFYIISAAWCLVEVAIMWFYFPETKAMTLEEVDIIFDGVRHAEVDMKVIIGEEVLPKGGGDSTVVEYPTSAKD